MPKAEELLLNRISHAFRRATTQSAGEGAFRKQASLNFLASLHPSDTIRSLGSSFGDLANFSVHSQVLRKTRIIVAERHPVLAYGQG